MLGPIVLDSDLSRHIINMLEGPQVELLALERKLAELEAVHGAEIYRHLFYVLGHLDFLPREAKSHWRGAQNTWAEISERLERPIDVRVAVLGYLLERRHKLRNPAVVEIELLQKAEEFAVRDELTRLYNYRYFRDRIGREVERSRRYGDPLSLLMIDVDNFKRFNDDVGHLAGNDALRELAEVFVSSVRAIDIVSRYGGEEFAILLPSTLRSGAIVAAEKIRSNSAKAGIGKGPSRAPLTVSVGVASLPGDAQDPETLVARADSALYLAKADGKNCVRCCSSERRESPRYFTRIEGKLRLLGDERLSIVTLDLSQGGLSFAVSQKLSMGDIVRIELSPPEKNEPFECTCRVIRVRPSKSEFHVGAQIIHMEGAHGYQLRQFLADLDAALLTTA
jgi:diguanylate cyclase (GGDEF)-like protein